MWTTIPNMVVAINGWAGHTVAATPSAQKAVASMLDALFIIRKFETRLLISSDNTHTKRDKFSKATSHKVKRRKPPDASG